MKNILDCKKHADLSVKVYVHRKLHNEEFHDLYSSPSIIRIIKSRRMRWDGNVARIGEKKNAFRFLVGNQRERGH
jgi:hypothetical protein